MKTAQITMISVLLLATTMLSAGDESNRGWSGLSLNDLKASSDSSFDLLDADENGSITLDEIDILGEDTEEEMSEEELVSLRQRSRLISMYFWTDEEINVFEVGDTDGDGLMNQKEFDNIESSVRTHTLELGLKSLDGDKNGSVESTEFSAHLDNFEEWDTNGNGTVEREEIAGITDRNLHAQIRLRLARQAEREFRGASEETRRRYAEERRAMAERERAKDSTED